MSVSRRHALTAVLLLVLLGLQAAGTGTIAWVVWRDPHPDTARAVVLPPGGTIACPLGYVCLLAKP